MPAHLRHVGAVVLLEVALGDDGPRDVVREDSLADVQGAAGPGDAPHADDLRRGDVGSGSDAGDGAGALLDVVDAGHVAEAHGSPLGVGGMLDDARVGAPIELELETYRLAPASREGRPLALETVRSAGLASADGGSTDTAGGSPTGRVGAGGDGRGDGGDSERKAAEEAGDTAETTARALGGLPDLGSRVAGGGGGSAKGACAGAVHGGDSCSASAARLGCGAADGADVDTETAAPEREKRNERRDDSDCGGSRPGEDACKAEVALNVSEVEAVDWCGPDLHVAVGDVALDVRRWHRGAEPTTFALRVQGGTRAERHGL